MVRHAIRLLISGALLLLAVAGCRESPDSPDEPLARITVASDGLMTIDNEQVNLSVAQLRLNDIAEESGVVWLYRAPVLAAPHPTTLALTDLLLDANIAVVISSEPDFADLDLRATTGSEDSVQ